MFTGIITDIGEIVDIILHEGGDKTFIVHCNYPADSVEIGASIAFNGVCLTIVNKKTAHPLAKSSMKSEQKPSGDRKDFYYVDVSKETLAKTTAKYWNIGSVLNLERALRVGDELGGHLVSGHVDCVSTLSSITRDGDSHRLTFTVPKHYIKYIAPKGSIVIDGVSLTINEVSPTTFGVNIIPHTWAKTIFHTNVIDDAVNLEIDIVARYIAHIMENSTTYKKI